MRVSAVERDHLCRAGRRTASNLRLPLVPQLTSHCKKVLRCCTTL
jgi:hypothetical protein